MSGKRGVAREESKRKYVQNMSPHLKRKVGVLCAIGMEHEAYRMLPRILIKHVRGPFPYGPSELVDEIERQEKLAQKEEL